MDETGAQKSPQQRQKYNSVTINTSLFQASNFFPKAK
jgi:hypothetical protein